MPGGRPTMDQVQRSLSDVVIDQPLRFSLHNGPRGEVPPSRKAHRAHKGVKRGRSENIPRGVQDLRQKNRKVRRVKTANIRSLIRIAGRVLPSQDKRRCGLAKMRRPSPPTSAVQTGRESASPAQINGHRGERPRRGCGLL